VQFGAIIQECLMKNLCGLATLRDEFICESVAKIKDFFKTQKSAKKCQKVPQNDRILSENDKEFSKKAERKR
jgi:hypothetical protein